MNKTSIDIEILFNSSKTLDPNYSQIEFGKYKIKTVPTLKESLTDTQESFILQFYDDWKEKQMYSNPIKEGDFVLSLLSLLFDAKIDYIASKSNNVQGSIKKSSSFQLEGNLETRFNIEDTFKKVNSMNIDLLRQYIRSCTAYRTALSLIDNNPTLSFFLLVIAIQAIAGKVIRKKHRENFSEFIISFLPKTLKDEIGDEKLLLLLIDEAYNMRCAFTQGGTSISLGTLSADNTNRNYLKHYIDGKETYSPSLRWFVKVVHAVLTNFLEQQKKVDSEEKLSDLAREEAVIYLKSAKTVKSGRIAFAGDFDLDFKQ